MRSSRYVLTSCCRDTSATWKWLPSIKVRPSLGWNSFVDPSLKIKRGSGGETKDARTEDAETEDERTEDAEAEDAGTKAE